MEERVDQLETMGKTLHSKSMEEDSKLHNNSVEEEKRLQSQFVAISKLCTSDVKSFSMPWDRPTDEVIHISHSMGLSVIMMLKSRWMVKNRELYPLVF